MATASSSQAEEDPGCGRCQRRPTLGSRLRLASVHVPLYGVRASALGSVRSRPPVRAAVVRGPRRCGGAVPTARYAGSTWSPVSASGPVGRRNRTSRIRSSRRSSFGLDRCRPRTCRVVLRVRVRSRSTAFPTRTGFRYAGCPPRNGRERGRASGPGRPDGLTCCRLGSTGWHHVQCSGPGGPDYPPWSLSGLGVASSGPEGPSGSTAGRVRGPSAAQTCSERRHLDADDALTCCFRGGGEGI